MKEPPKYNNLLRYAGLASQWMFLLLAAVWLGYKLDHWIAWKFPVLLVLLPVITLVYLLWQIIKEFSKPDNK